MSEEKTGIESMTAILSQLEIIAVSVKTVMEDGKVSLADLPTAISLLSNISAMVETFKNASQAWDEAKDIDADEAVALVKKMYEIGKNLEKA